MNTQPISIFTQERGCISEARIFWITSILSSVSMSCLPSFIGKKSKMGRLSANAVHSMPDKRTDQGAQKKGECYFNEGVGRLSLKTSYVFVYPLMEIKWKSAKTFPSIFLSDPTFHLPHWCVFRLGEGGAGLVFLGTVASTQFRSLFSIGS